MAGLQLLHVPYKSGPQAMTDLGGGQLTIYLGGVPGFEVNVWYGLFAPRRCRRNKPAACCVYNCRCHRYKMRRCAGPVIKLFLSHKME
jgi:hypothetical protein